MLTQKTEIKVGHALELMARPHPVQTAKQSVMGLPWATKLSDTKMANFVALNERVLDRIGKCYHEQYFS